MSDGIISYDNNEISWECVEDNDLFSNKVDYVDYGFTCPITTTQAGPAAGESGDYPFAIEFKVASALAETVSAYMASLDMAAEDEALTGALGAALEALLRVKDILDAAKFTQAADEVSQR